MHYRSYSLPWEVAAEQEKTFAKVWQRTIIAALLFAIIVPWLPLPDVDIDKQEEIPERFARLLIEKKVEPPPPKPVDIPVESEAPKPAETVTETPQEPPKPVPPEADQGRCAQKSIACRLNGVFSRPCGSAEQ